MKSAKLNRREFLGVSCSLAALPSLTRHTTATQIFLLINPDDQIANTTPVKWATGEVETALLDRKIDVRRIQSLSEVTSNGRCVVVSGASHPSTRELLKKSNVVVADKPESLALIPLKLSTRSSLCVCGSDTRGLVYALLDLADRVRHAGTDDVFALPRAISEQPSNSIRSVLRLFASDIEDKPWFNNKEFWSQYLTMLATQRFNRFNLSLSLGYDFLRRVTDAYFLFPYPFLMAVPGYQVRVPQLPNAERDRNLEMLKFISEQTVARGLEFQLGLWMHGYVWNDSPNANYTIEGLTQETHATYSRDALRLLLQTCPAITGVTIRTHGESGVEEGSYQFWKTVFDGVATCGRRVEIDLHPKGLDERMLNNALATRQPITVSPKFWAEHLGLPYHQTDIRKLEIPDPNKQTSRLMNLSEGSRSFMRYGYGDLLREDRKWKVIHRVWPGSQRLLIWGDPLSASAYSKAFGFCGSDGAEIMEPLTFKGRRGSGIAGDRCAYTDPTLRTKWDWQKYEYSYRVWGRLLYNPACSSEVWQRYLRKQLGEGAAKVETSVASASRILPLITTAHLPSAANNNYWPEMYVNHSLFDAEHRGSYSDTPVPRVFGNVSPLDPELFYRINDFTDDLLHNGLNGRYTPLEVAKWLDDYATAAEEALNESEVTKTLKRAPDKRDYRRFVTDVVIQAGLGHFFAAKFRAGVLFRVFEQTREPSALAASLQYYRGARRHWAKLAAKAKGVYMNDVTIGELPQLHGHWLDRIPGIDKDIAALEGRLATTKSGTSKNVVAQIIKVIESRPVRTNPSCDHSPPKFFTPGRPLELVLRLKSSSMSSKLHFRHVNQAERFEVIVLEQSKNKHHATIPADYTESPYPLQYYFEIKSFTNEVSLYPGFSAGLMSEPYFVVRRGAIGTV